MKFKAVYLGHSRFVANKSEKKKYDQIAIKSQPKSNKIIIVIKYFVKDIFQRAASPRILKFPKNIGYDLLYCVRENQHTHAYHILYLSIFVFLQYKFFITDFSAPKTARVFKFCIHLQKIEVYCVKDNHDAQVSFAFFLPFSHLSLQCNA